MLSHLKIMTLKSISGLYFNLNMYELTFYIIWTVPKIEISLWFVLNTFQQRYLCTMELWRNDIIFKVVNVKQIQVSVYFTLHNNNCHPAPCCNPDCCSHMFHTARLHPFWFFSQQCSFSSSSTLQDRWWLGPGEPWKEHLSQVKMNEKGLKGIIGWSGIMYYIWSPLLHC